MSSYITTSIHNQNEPIQQHCTFGSSLSQSGIFLLWEFTKMKEIWHSSICTVWAVVLEPPSDLSTGQKWSVTWSWPSRLVMKEVGSRSRSARPFLYTVCSLSGCLLFTAAFSPLSISSYYQGLALAHAPWGVPFSLDVPDVLTEDVWGKDSQDSARTEVHFKDRHFQVQWLRLCNYGDYVFAIMQNSLGNLR